MLEQGLQYSLVVCVNLKNFKLPDILVKFCIIMVFLHKILQSLFFRKHTNLIPAIKDISGL